MNFLVGSPAANANAVWNATTRKLTSIFGPLSQVGTVNQSLAASTAFVFAVSAAKMHVFTAAAKAGAAGTAVFQLIDGTNTFTMLTITAASTGFVSGIEGTASMTIQLTNNDATNAVVYSYNYIEYA